MALSIGKGKRMNSDPFGPGPATGAETIIWHAADASGWTVRSTHAHWQSTAHLSQCPNDALAPTPTAVDLDAAARYKPVLILLSSSAQSAWKPELRRLPGLRPVLCEEAMQRLPV